MAEVVSAYARASQVPLIFWSEKHSSGNRSRKYTIDDTDIVYVRLVRFASTSNRRVLAIPYLPCG